ncbi:MAG: LamG-like jellyroll fold domain-containing protein [Bacteroidota bacterium]
MTEGRIETPRELNEAANMLDLALVSLRSPQLQLHTLIDFFSSTSHLPLAWRRSYLLPHAQTLTRLLLHPYTQAHHPHLWVSALQFLRTLEESAAVPLDAKEALGELLLKGCLVHAFVADLRGLHAYLKEGAIPVQEIDERRWRQIYGAGPAPLAMFEAYCESQEAKLSEHHVLFRARQRWRRFHTREDAVSVVLLETEQREVLVAGAVLQMEIVSRRSSNGGIHINNVLGSDAGKTRRQLESANELAMAFTQQHTGYRFERREVFYQFIDLHAAFSGGSLGLAATVGLACHLSKQVNGSVRWNLSPDTACIGSLDDTGDLEPSSWDTIRRKLKLAFFSPLRRVVIPNEYFEQSIRHIQQLQLEYPHRGFEVYPAGHYSDCFRPEHVVECINRNPYDRVQTFAKRHSRSLILLIALITLVAAGGLFYRSFVAFPNLEAVRGIEVGNSAIVFNPHDSVDWAFRDGKLLRSPVIRFGDLEVGDGFTRNFSLFNMTPGPKEVHVSIEGRDNGEWYISSGNGTKILESTVPMNVSIMYAPTTAAADKEAALVIRDGPGGEEYFRLRLEGGAGRAMPGGYALQLNGGPDYLTWGTNSLAFSSGELTIESWVRSLNWNGCFLNNGSNAHPHPGLENLTISFSDGTPQIFIGNETFTIPLPMPMEPNQWHHIALAYSITRRSISFFIDGISVFERKTDFRMQSRMKPFVSLGAIADSARANGYLACEVDNFRVWWSVLGAKDLQRVMHRTLPGNESRLQANFDMETNSENTAFNGNNATADAELRYRPVSVRSTAPVMAEGQLPRLIDGPQGLPGLSLPPGSYLFCARQLLPQHSDACFSFWWYSDIRRSTAFVYQNLDHYLSFSCDTVATSFSGCTSDILGSITRGWHHVVIRVLRTGEREIFIDGAQRGTIAPCTTPGSQFYDWHYRYGGISFGIFDDTYNMFSGNLHAIMLEGLGQTRKIAGIAIWRRLLCNEEIVRLAKGAEPPPDHLVAYWQFDTAPSAEMNFTDRMSGNLLHIKSAPAYR